jgi:hypothetical protein
MESADVPNICTPAFKQRFRQVERSLPAELGDDAFGAGPFHHVHHIFQGQRLKEKLVGRVVIRGDGFRVTIDHDGFIAALFDGPGRVDATIVELDALADAVGTAPQNDHPLFLDGGRDSSSSS